MTGQYELISHVLCPYVQRSVIVLKEKNIPFKRTDIDLANKPDWFLKLSPLGKVPVLKVGDVVLFESAVISEYLDEVTEGSLHPADPLVKAQHRAWIEFASAILADIWNMYTTKDMGVFEEKVAQIKQKLKRVNDVLDAKGPYFAGETFHLVDAVFAPTLRYFPVFEAIKPFHFYEGLDKLSRYAEALKARQSVKDAVKSDYNEARLAAFKTVDSHLATLIA